ncbi:intercellular adhesion molecule 4 [Acomys russatus]|uniref:intercellular adhesion molecule 4 n=1 Tax=Acomys russatus TaxID=60746 RepID=UPI0021E27104|nr:intercellular adhesion molecule 4 [Acomys russatus]
MESIFLLPSLLLMAVYPRGGSPQHEWMQNPPVPSVTSVPFLVHLNPELQAVPPGYSVWLNCSHSCPLPAHSSLHTQLQQGKTLNGSGWVSYQLLDVRAWISKVRCIVTCAGETQEATARITAFSEGNRGSGRAGMRGEGWRKWVVGSCFRRCLVGLTLLALEPPRSVILEPPVLVGHTYTLRCYVTHVFPVGFLVVSLRRGGQVVHFQNLEHFTRSDLANVTLIYPKRAGPNDLLQPLTCHARLNLDGLVVHRSSAPVMLTVLALSPASIALTSTSIAAVVGMLLVGIVYVRKCLAVQTQL